MGAPAVRTTLQRVELLVQIRRMMMKRLQLMESVLWCLGVAATELR